MDFKRLQYFLAIHRRGSFLKAASSLGLTQPALSRQMALLERELGRKVFLRSAAGVHLTPDGQRFLPHALAIEDLLSTMQDIFSEDSPLSGSYTISCGGTVSALIVPLAARKIREAHPKLALRVIEGDAYSTLHSVTGGEADLGILSGRPDVPGLETEFFFKDSIVPVAAAKHPAAQKRMRPEQLRNQEFVLFHPSSAVRQAVDLKLKSLRPEWKPRVSMEVRSLETAIRSIEAGAGIGFISSLALTRGMKRVQCPELETDRDFFFCYRRKSRATDEVIHIVKSIGRKKAGATG